VRTEPGNSFYRHSPEYLTAEKKRRIKFLSLAIQFHSAVVRKNTQALKGRTALSGLLNFLTTLAPL
jgi:hypothetical protein